MTTEARLKKVKFIYNPYSGEQVILKNLDNVIKIHQKYKYIVEPYRIEKDDSVGNAFNGMNIDEYKYILIAGGDGTVDSVVNAMKENNIDLPIGILPVGTANDFGKFLGISSNVTQACEDIINYEEKPIDIGKANGKYFVNVASTGLFTDISQKTDDELKNAIGKIAYYIKSIEEIPNFRRLKVKVSSKEVDFDDEMYLLLVFNGQTAGNMRLAVQADASDGMLDVIIFKATLIHELLPLFIKVLRGDHLDDSKVLYFKTKELLIETNEDIVTDIDGEKGPDFPVKIECIQGGIKIRGIK